MKGSQLADMLERPVTFGAAFGYSNIVTKDGTIVASRVPNSHVVEQRNLLREFAGRELDIVEIETYGVRDEKVMDGTAPVPFGHTISQHFEENPEVVSGNRSHIAPSGGGADYAPIKPPTWRKKGETKKVGKEKVYRSHETRYSNPGRGKDWYILQVSDLRSVYSGTREAGIQVLSQRVARRGEHLNDYKVIHRTMLDKYLDDVSNDGWVAYVNGERRVTGLMAEVKNFLDIELKAKRIAFSAIVVKHISQVA